MSSHFDIVPAAPEHLPFIVDSLTRSLRDQAPWKWVARPMLVEDFRRRCADPLTMNLVAHVRGEPGLWLGWLAGIPTSNEVIFGFTKYNYRAVPDLRVCTTLAEAAGIDFSATVFVRYWTRATERIAQKPGYKLIHVVTEEDDRNGRHRPLAIA